MQSICGFNGFVVFIWIYFYSLMKKFYSLTANGHASDRNVNWEKKITKSTDGQWAYYAKHSFEPYAYSISGRTKIPISKLKTFLQVNEAKEEKKVLVYCWNFLCGYLIFNGQQVLMKDEKRPRPDTRFVCSVLVHSQMQGTAIGDRTPRTPHTQFSHLECGVWCDDPVILHKYTTFLFHVFFAAVIVCRFYLNISTETWYVSYCA